MTSNSGRPDDGTDSEPAEGGYGFADTDADLPPRPPVSPPLIDEEPIRDEHEMSLEEETRPVRRRKKRRLDGDEGAEPIGEEPGDRILSREEVQSPPNWWHVPTALFVVGFILSLIPVGVLTAKAGASAGAGLFGLLLVGLIVQVVAVVMLLIVVGTFFGIDYGPAVEAVVKLAAVVAVVDGLTMLFLQIGFPLGLIVAAFVGAGVFQYLFRLSIHEMLLSVVPMVAAAWVLNFAVVTVQLQKEQKKKGNPASFVPGNVAEMVALPWNTTLLSDFRVRIHFYLPYSADAVKGVAHHKGTKFTQRNTKGSKRVELQPSARFPSVFPLRSFV